MNVFYKIGGYKSSIYAVLLIIIFINLRCAENKTDRENILATVNNREISIKEFRLFYEFDPNFGIDSGGLPALRDELDKYINQSLAAEKAENQLVTNDPEFDRAIRWEQRSAMLRQLYRERVNKNIQVTDDEIIQEFKNTNASVHIRHLFTPDRDQAKQWYDQLQQGVTFEYLAEQAFDDTVLVRKGGDLGWISLRDLDDDFSTAAAKLNLNEISRPVKTRWGFHILQLLDRKDVMSMNPAELHNQKNMLEKRIRQNKSRALSTKYIQEFIGGLNPQPDKQTFALLLKSIVPGPEQENAEYSRTFILGNDLIEHLGQLPQEILDKPLIVWTGGVISFGAYISAQLDVPVSNRPHFKSPKEFSNQIGVWIRDELLYREAERLDLGTNMRVQHEVQIFIEEQSYYYYLGQQVNMLKVPPDVKIYFSTENRVDHPMQKELNRFHTIEQWKYRRAEELLHEDLRRSNPEIYINIPLLIKENARINWEGRIRMFMIRKPS